MDLYILSGLSIIIFLFLAGLCVQLLRIEKTITRLNYYVENRVTKLLNSKE